MRVVLLMILMMSQIGLSVSTDPSFVVHILSYIRKDYSEAIDPRGNIKSATEFQEQLDFVSATLEAVSTIPELSSDSALKRELLALQDQIRRRDQAESISKRCLEIQSRVMKLAQIKNSPIHWPNRVHGKALYERNCATCHGISGHGDGPSGRGLDPKPTNFYESRMNDSTPFELFSTIKLGVPGTGMASFSSLSESEIWDLAFHVSGLRHEWSSPAKTLPLGITLYEVASKSDNELGQRFSPEILGAVRLYVPEVGHVAFTLLARRKLQHALNLIAEGNHSGARQTVVAAYLEGIEPIEPRLRVRDTRLVTEIEQQMGNLRAAISAGYSFESIKSRVDGLLNLLSQADEVLQRSATSVSFTFSVAAGIVLREAFEAVLIIITLLGVIRSIGSRQAAFFVHGGWLLAVMMGVLVWFFSGWLIEIGGARREFLEGTVAIIAVIVLLYFGFWLHRKTEIGRWRTFLNDMVKTAVSGKNLLALGIVSFMAVFREAFETVLFLRALLLESGTSQQWAVLAGVSISFVIVVLLAAALVKFSVRIPIRQLFGISSLVMVLLSLILIGKAVHSFQETGLLTITQLPIRLRFELIGFYPTYETIFSQVVVLVLSTIFWIHGRRSSGLLRQTA